MSVVMVDLERWTDGDWGNPGKGVLTVGRKTHYSGNVPAQLTREWSICAVSEKAAKLEWGGQGLNRTKKKGKGKKKL